MPDLGALGLLVSFALIGFGAGLFVARVLDLRDLLHAQYEREMAFRMRGRAVLS